MDLSDDARLDAMVAAGQFEDCGGFSRVTVPGFSELNQAEKLRVAAKIDQRSVHPPLDADALARALESARHAPPGAQSLTLTHGETEDDDIITPPPGGIEEDIEQENKARKRLEEYGCPPCYPPHIEFPFVDLPDEYRDIISYWQSQGGGIGRLALDAQALDWKWFQNFQRNVRLKYRRRRFFEYEARVRRRRGEYGALGDAHLRLDPEQQTRHENWVEFQYCELLEHDNRKKKIEKLISEQEHEPLEAQMFQYKLGYLQRRYQLHEGLLRWIDKELCSMVDQLASPPVDHDGNSRSQADAHNGGVAVRGSPDPSSSTHPSSKVPCGPQKPSPLLPANEQSTSPPQAACNSRNAGAKRQGKPRLVKDQTLRQFHPQKVAKAKSKHPPGRSSRPVTEVRTRSRRVSRAPEMWAPGAR